MKTKIGISFVLCLLTNSVNAETVSQGESVSGFAINDNYSYLGLNLGGGKYNPDHAANSNITVSDVLLQMQLNSHWILGLEYKGRFIHYEYRNDQAGYLSLNLGYRVPLRPQTDLILGTQLGYSKTKGELDNGSVVFKNEKFMSAINAGVYQQFTKQWQGRAIIEYMDSVLKEEVSIKLGADYAFNHYFSLGGYGKLVYADHANLNHLGISVKLHF